MEKINNNNIDISKYEFNPPLTSVESKFINDIITVGRNIKDQRALMSYIIDSFDCIKRLDFEIT